MMSNDFAIYLSKQLLWHAVLISAPLVITALIIGLIVSLLQVVTQIQDSTLSFVPKVLAVLIALAITGEWMLRTLIHFTESIIQNIPEYVR